MASQEVVLFEAMLAPSVVPPISKRPEPSTDAQPVATFRIAAMAVSAECDEGKHYDCSGCRCECHPKR